jgi:hypothetical protein
MKVLPTSDAFPNNLPAQDASREQPYQSLFSLLLEIESKLRAETRSDSLLQARQRKLAKSKKLPRPAHLSRYIE